jgi:hypothetical protein
MRNYTLEGKVRSRLREAVLAGFSPPALDEVLRDNDMFRPNIASGPNFTARVASLIEVAYEEGWLIELCRVLAAERAGNEAVSSAIKSVQKYLMEQGTQPTLMTDSGGANSDLNVVDQSNGRWNLPKLAQNNTKFYLISGLLVAAIGAAVYLTVPTIRTADSDPEHKSLPGSKTEAHSGGLAVGGDVKGSIINMGAPSAAQAPKNMVAPSGGQASK